MPERKRKQETEEKVTFRERVADAIDISKEVILDTVVISMIGDRELTLENYKNIITYSDTCIRVKAKPFPVKITGKGLEIKNINRDLLYITGRIHQFGFLKEG